MKRTMLAVALMLTVATVAQAVPTAYFELTTAGNTWEVKMWTSAGDNAGLAGASIFIEGIATATKLSPGGAMMLPNYTAGGFILGAASPAVTTRTELFAGQDPQNTQQIFNYGRAAGSADFYIFPPPPGSIVTKTWDATPVMFSGTFNVGQTPALVVDAGQGANVFTGTSSSAQVPAEIVFVPEPATMALLALGGLAVIRRRR